MDQFDATVSSAHFDSGAMLECPAVGLVCSALLTICMFCGARCGLPFFGFSSGPVRTCTIFFGFDSSPAIIPKKGEEEFVW